MEGKNDNLRWLYENFNFIDSVAVVDHKGTIIAKKRFNPRYSDEENRIHNEQAIGRNLLEVYPSLNHEESTFLQVLNTGKIIYRENQEVWSHLGRKTVCNNLTFPIIAKGKIVGAVEISRDITHMERQVKPAKAKAGQSRNLGTAKYYLEDIITGNPEMAKIKETIGKIANRSSSVLVYGETGTGKELVVSAIHNAGYRKAKPFIPVNCAALPESILEGLLFGSRRGAFTGAEEKKGLFEEANGGTIYLDEINSMPLNLQAKLLRVLQEKNVLPLGESKPIPVDVRIVASTNKSPDELLSDGEIRLDLLYRLNTININIPPLRDRTEDIPLLVEHFLSKYNQDFDKNVTGVSSQAQAFLLNYQWIGNVRELEHVVEAAMNVAEDNGKLTVEDLPAYLTIKEPPRTAVDVRPLEMTNGTETQPSLQEAVEALEQKMILDSLQRCRGKVSQAAKQLKIPRTTLQYKMEKYGIER